MGDGLLLREGYLPRNFGKSHGHRRTLGAFPFPLIYPHSPDYILATFQGKDSGCSTNSHLLNRSHIGCAAPFALARVLSLTPVVAALTSALAFTLVLTFACVLPFFRIGEEGDARPESRRGGSSRVERPFQNSGNSRRNKYWFG
jgi:hypothetical protein